MHGKLSGRCSVLLDCAPHFASLASMGTKQKPLLLPMKARAENPSLADYQTRSKLFTVKLTWFECTKLNLLSYTLYEVCNM